jgi:hypothetical protein
LELYRLDKNPSTRSAQNKAVVKWCKNALKRKTLPKEAGPFIHDILTAYESHPLLVNLKDFIEVRFYYYKVAMLNTKRTELSECERFHLAVESIKNKAWNTIFPLDHDPFTQGSYEPVMDKEVFSLKQDFQDAFNNGVLIKTLDVYVCGPINEIILAFYEQGIILGDINQKVYKGQNLALVRIFPKNNYSGKIHLCERFFD